MIQMQGNRDMKPGLPDPVRSLLEGLFDGDADALNRGARLVHDVDETLERAAVGEEVVDEKHLIARQHEARR